MKERRRFFRGDFVSDTIAVPDKLSEQTNRHNIFPTVITVFSNIINYTFKCLAIDWSLIELAAYIDYIKSIFQL